MKTHLLPAIKLTLVCIVFFVGVYTVVLWGIAQFAAPNHGNGAVLEVNGKVVGYALIGQSFTNDKYFNGRPSAVAYNAAGSGGSNKGPSNPDYLADVQKRIDTLMLHNPGISKAQIPVDMVTASGSGLDPDISVKGAMIQIPRIAKIRGLSEEVVTKLVKDHTEKPLLGFLGPQKINVLKLNIALDGLTTK